MTSFIHNRDLNITTLSELVRIHNSLQPDEFFGCYAYATQSGFRAFELAFGDDFWLSTSSRWLVGIDYGRTDPRALREILKRANTEVRVFDGAWVVDQEGFAPRRDFHAKVAIMQNTEAKISGIVSGSGNFSYNGLKRSVEAGVSLIAKSDQKLQKHISPVKDPFEKFWESSTPILDILDTYEARKKISASESDSKKPKGNAKPETHGFGVYDGKVLVFERIGGSFLMQTFELMEFETLFANLVVKVRKMNRGRRYGAIV